MFERFSEKARRVMVYAQEEARALHHDFIGTEHLLLGVLDVEDSIAAAALADVGVAHEVVRTQVESLVGHPPYHETASPPFTPRAKRVLELSLREALTLGHNYIGTEHILLGLMTEGEGVAVRALEFAGCDLGRLRAAVLARVSALGSSRRRGRTQAMSPAAGAAMRKAAAMPGSPPITTGLIVAAILEDPSSQGARALHALGVTVESLGTALASIPARHTSDAPAPHVEIRVGPTSTVLDDPDLASAVSRIPPEKLQDVVRAAVMAAGLEAAPPDPTPPEPTSPDGGPEADPTPQPDGGPEADPTPQPDDGD